MNDITVPSQALMSPDQFRSPVLMLSVVFPNRRIEPEIYYELLKDLEPQSVLDAVVSICKEKQLYPDSNLIAMIRDYAQPKSRFAKEIGDKKK